MKDIFLRDKSIDIRRWADGHPSNIVCNNTCNRRPPLLPFAPNRRSRSIPRAKFLARKILLLHLPRLTKKRKKKEARKGKRCREREPRCDIRLRFSRDKRTIFRYRRYAGDLLAGIRWRAPIRRSSGGEALRTDRRITSQYIVVGQLRGSVTFSR